MPISVVTETLKPVDNDPPFTGDNSYTVTFAVEGARANTVKKKLSELFLDCDDIEVENKFKRKSRAEELAEAQAIVEGLRDGLLDWRDNLPENFQSGEKADQLDECIQQLDALSGEFDGIEFPSAFGG